MNLDVTKSIGGPKSITGLCTDLFLIAIRVREAEDLGAPEALRKLITYYIDRFGKNCKALSIPQESVDECTYAVVALIDETVLSVPGECRDYWLARPLQLDYFGTNLAGQEFFQKLERIIVSIEKKKDVLDVYYLCLSLGFEGKYKMGNAQERTAIVEDLGNKLSRSRGGAQGPLSPHSYFAEATGGRVRGAVPVPLWAVAAGCAGAVAAWYAVLQFLNSSQASAVLDIVRQVSAR